MSTTQSALEAARQLAEALIDEDAKELVSTDMVTRIALKAARIVGEEIVRKRGEALKRAGG